MCGKNNNAFKPSIFSVPMIQNYSRLVEKIAKASGKETQEIDRLVEAKRAKLSGLISREGAAQIIAAELGISFEKEKVKVNEIVDGMRKVNMIGKIVRMFPVREFKKETREGKVANMLVADETGSIKLVLWDTNHISLVETGEIKDGDVVEVSNAGVRSGEIHLSSFSDIKLSTEKIENVKMGGEFSDKKIFDFKIGENIKTRAVIVQAFEPRFFNVCPECNSKVFEGAEGSVCEKHGKVVPSRRALISVVLDDGGASMRGVLFSEGIEGLGYKISELEGETFAGKKREILGKEAYFYGNVRQNKLFNNTELFISKVEDIDIEKLIELLEKR
jgi:replication factor A1